MRILELIDNATLGGAEKHTRIFAEELSRQGHEVLLVHPKGPYASSFAGSSRYGVEVVELPTIRSAPTAAIRQLGELCNRFGAQVVHSHQYRADLLASLVPSARSLIRSTTIHNFLGKDLPWTRSPLKRALYHPLSLLALRRMDLIIATSSYGAHYVERSFRLQGGRVAVILNAIDPSELDNPRNRDSVRDGLGIPRLARVVACAATLEPRKGQEFLIRAVARLSNASRPYLLLLGTGPMQEELLGLARLLGVDGRVRLLGFRKDAKDIVAASDVYVQPSLVDPLPRALLEAMYLRVPVIASAVDGIPDVVEHGVTGYLVPPRSVACLTRYLEQVLAGGNGQMAALARAFVAENCTIQSMVRSFVRLAVDKLEASR